MPSNQPATATGQFLVPVELIERRIYLVRGHKVIIDSDLAELYQVETRSLVQAVKRNLDRFPAGCMFQLSGEEAEAMRSQFVIASKRNIRYQPYAFTEHGALMLASVLKSKRAVQMSIALYACSYSSANSWPATKTLRPEWKSWKLLKRTIRPFWPWWLTRLRS